MYKYGISGCLQQRSSQANKTEWIMVNLELKKKLLQREITEQECESFRDNGKKVPFYNGLPSFFLKPHILGSKFKIPVLTLMQLCLNLPMKDLAYRFQIS